MRRRSDRDESAQQLVLPLWGEPVVPDGSRPEPTVTSSQDRDEPPETSTPPPPTRPRSRSRARHFSPDQSADTPDTAGNEDAGPRPPAPDAPTPPTDPEPSSRMGLVSPPVQESDGASAGASAARTESIPAGAGASPRISELIPRFLEFATAIDRSPHTIQTTRVDLNLLVRHLGDRPATEISLDDLRRFANWLRHERQNDPRSLRRKVASVKAFFSYLRNTGIRDDDPAEMLVYPSSQPHLPEFLETDEASRLVAAAERPLWRALVLTLLETGLKRDEVLALHPADVYIDPAAPERGYLTVRATNQARRVRTRTLPLSPRLASELRRQIQTGAGERIFPISVRAVNTIVETCGQRAGIHKRGPISPQMLRDTFAVHEVRRRVLEEDRARRAGATDRDLAALRLRHDLEVCDLLGLTPSPTNDPIARYRVLAAAPIASRR